MSGDLRFAVARSMLVDAVKAGPGTHSLIRRAALEADVADEWAADVFWELVRLGFLDASGCVRCRDGLS